MYLKIFQLLFFVVLHISLKQTTALFTKNDVQDCITNTKQILQDQQTSVRAQLDQIKAQKISEAKEHKDRKFANLNTYIQKEKGVLTTFKQSAIQDDYNVTSCNDSSAVFDLIANSYGTGAEAILAEYSGLIGRNYTQSLFLLNQFASNHRQLEKKLDECQENSNCLENLQGECEMMNRQDDMEDVESDFTRGAERFNSDLRSRIDALYQEKTKEALNHSQQIKECYKSARNVIVDGDGTIEKDAGEITRPVVSLILLPLIYVIFS